MEYAALAAAAISAAGNYASTTARNNAAADQASAQMFNDWNMFNAQQMYAQQNTAQAQGQQWRIMESQNDYSREMFERASQQQNQILDRTMAYNSQVIGRQENFQREMSNSAYQRAMADMRAAGLNPMLAYSQGGATTPTGSTGSAVSGSSPSAGAAGSGSTSQASAPTGRGYQQAQIEQVIGPAIASAREGAMFLTDLQQRQANVDRTRAETQVALRQVPNIEQATALGHAQEGQQNALRDRTRLEAETERLRPGEVAARTTESRASAARIAAEEELARARAARESQSTDREGRFGTGRIGQETGSMLGIAREAGNSVSGAVSDAARGVSRWISALGESLSRGPLEPGGRGISQGLRRAR